jgi:hypothetical protein
MGWLPAVRVDAVELDRAGASYSSNWMTSKSVHPTLHPLRLRLVVSGSAGMRYRNRCGEHYSGSMV